MDSYPYKIYVEPIFDTSKKVIPHDAIWLSLQEVFISSGKLRLISKREDSDYFLRVHLSKVSIVPKAFQGQGGSDVSELSGPSLRTKNPPSLGSFSGGLTSRDFAISQNLAITLEFELWSFHLQEKIWHKSYLASGERSLYDSHDQLKTHFIRSEENLVAVINSLSKQIGHDCLRDIFRVLRRLKVS